MLAQFSMARALPAVQQVLRCRVFLRARSVAAYTTRTGASAYTVRVSGLMSGGGDAYSTFAWPAQELSHESPFLLPPVG